MNFRVHIALLFAWSGATAFAEGAGYGFDYSTSDIPNSSIYQMLYRPQIKEDVPFTSIYNEIYDEGYDGDFDRDEVSGPMGTSLSGLASAGEFETDFASDFSVSKDFFGVGKWTGNPNRYTGTDRPLRCGRGYVSERLDPETLSIVRTCAGMDSGELDTTSGNAFLANSSDSTLKKFGDANSFVQAMNADARRTERLRNQAMASGMDVKAAQRGIAFSDEMISMLEKFAATSPGLRDVLDEAIATGDVKTVYRRIQEAGGLEALMSQAQGSGKSQQIHYDYQDADGY